MLKSVMGQKPTESCQILILEIALGLGIGLGSGLDVWFTLVSSGFRWFPTSGGGMAGKGGVRPGNGAFAWALW